MNIEGLLAQLNEKGVQISLDNDQLVVRARRGAMDAALADALKRHKAELLAWLRAHSTSADAEPSPRRITPRMLTLVSLPQDAIDRIVADVEGGADNVQDIYPLAPLQEGILFHHLKEQAGDPYLLSNLLAFEDRARLESFLAALQQVIDRHDILRTGIAWDGLDEPVQVVRRRAALPVQWIEFDASQGEVAAQLEARFDPRRHRIDVGRAPLIRAHAASDNRRGRWLLHVLVHHLISDHTTLELLIDETRAIERGEGERLAPPVPFRNFVAEARQGVSPAEHKAFFRDLLGEIDAPTAPFGLLDAHRGGEDLVQHRRVLAPVLSRAIRQLSRGLGTSPATLMHLAWALVLSRLTGRRDVVFGTVLFGRMQGGAGADRGFGLFMNTLPVRIAVGDLPAAQALEDTRLLLARLLRHEHASLALAQRCSAVPGHAPLFTSVLNYRHSAELVRASEGATHALNNGVTLLRGDERTNYPVSLDVDDAGTDFMLTAQVPASVAPQRLCDWMAQALSGLTQALQSAPQRSLAAIEILSSSERERVLYEWSGRARPDAARPAPPPGTRLHRLFEHQAAQRPDAIALEQGGVVLTYAEVNTRANRLAHHLRGRGVRPEDRVVVCGPRCPDVVVALLAVLKAGGAYVPLDPAYPAERLVQVLQDSGAALALVLGGLPVGVASGTAASLALLDLEADAGRWAAESSDDPAVPAATQGRAALAYVIYTSGSAGRPKGVMVEHQAVANQNRALAGQLRLQPTDRVLQFASLAFDASVEEIFATLTHGATLVLRDDRWLADAATFWSLCARHRITVVDLPTQFWSQLALERATPAACVRWAVIGGEAVGSVALAAWFEPAEMPRPRLLNTYGPTEATVTVCWREVGPDAGTWRSIGRPIDNTRLYILDERGRPVPPGVVGELHIGGVQLARGYLDQPELTAGHFVDDPFEPGGRLYKTGDLARWRDDGEVEYQGRNDFQVKIRGFRIEPAEIEAQLCRHAGVREVVVLAREDRPGEAQLVAYYTADGTLDAGVLRRHSSATLPAHMVPVAYVRLDAWPLGPGGKLDRRSLPAPDATAWVHGGHEAPQGATEQRLAEIWADLLQCERVGRHDNFFELGGHSLLAVRLVSRLRKELGVELGLATVFEDPVLARLARCVAEAVPATARPIVPVGADGPVPVSPAQRRLWFLAQTDAASLAYHLGGAIRLTGALDADALTRALQALMDRHAALRTRFGLRDGEPVQAVASRAALPLEFLDLRGSSVGEAEARERLSAHAARVFDLTKDLPIRGLLLRLADDEHVLQLVMHHIVSDAWSVGLLQHELGRLYAAFAEGVPDPLPPLEIQYADFAAWQRRAIEDGLLQRQAAFWCETLAGAPQLLELPCDRPRGSQQNHAGAAVPVRLDPTLTGALKSLGQRHGATLFMTLLATWAALLTRLSGQDEVVIGSPVAGRERVELEPLVGFFVNTLALRLHVGAQASVGELLAHVKAQVLAAQAHQALPFDQVVEAVNPPRSLAHAPLFQVMLDWQNAPDGGLQLPGVRATPWDQPQPTAQFDLTLSLREGDDGITGAMNFATALFDHATVERHLGHWLTLLRGLLSDERQTVGRLPLLDEAERRRLLNEGNQVGRDVPVYCLHQRFEAQAARTPHAIALVHGVRRCTYGELNAQANRLARHLRRQGVGPDRLIAICMDRGIDLIVAMLATLKAGGAYVPLDPAYASERLRATLHDSQPVALLLDDTGRAALGEGPEVALAIDLDADAVKWAEAPAQDLPAGEADVQPHHLAYVIYTSGSTGQPKGVMVEHRQVARLFGATEAWFDFGPQDCWSFFHSFGFDFSVWEIWGALLHGGRLVVVPLDTARSPESFLQLLCEQGVTVLNQTPSAFQQLIAAQGAHALPHRLRHVVFGGEALDLRILKPWYEREVNRETSLHNMYGITETTVHVTHQLLRPEDADRPGPSPIGGPIQDLRLYVLDAQRQLVPVGVTGELYVGGAGVARGYLRREELTAQRFLEDPFHAGRRLYKTGDLARWLPDGTLEYLGRNDLQVKIRGFRIELGEIEAHLARHPGVREVVVMAREDEPGDKRLVAYYSSGPEAPSPESLRDHATRHLPSYMVPSAYVPIGRLPLTPNGKLDRKALPAPDAQAHASRAYEEPQGEAERLLAQCWTQLLKIERVGRNDHFFELGGHSLLAVSLIERLREASLHLDVRTLFLKPVLRELAAELSAAGSGFSVPPNLIPEGAGRITPEMLPLVRLSQAQVDAIVADVDGGAANVQDIYPLAPLQEGILFHSLMAPASDPYLVHSLLGFDSRDRLERFLAALEEVMRRHDILRTGFSWQGLERPVQVVWRRVALPIEWPALDPAQGDVLPQLHALAASRRASLDLRRAPLLRLDAAEDRARDRWVLSVVSHHLIDDNTTFKLLVEESRAIEQGGLAALPRPVPFRDFIAQARQGGASAAEHEAFFRDMLGAIDTPTTPFGLADTRGDGNDVDECSEPVPSALSQGLRVQARRLGVSPASLMHLAWGLVLSRATGRERVVFGTVLLGRLQSGTQAHRALGLFINTLPIRVDVDAQDVVQAARATHERLAQLLRHEHASLALAQRCSGVPAQLPLFASLLNYRHSEEIGRDRDAGGPLGPGIESLGGHERTNYPLTLSVDDLGEGFAITAQAAAPLAPARVCEFMRTALEQLLDSLERAPGRETRQIDVLPAGERDRLLQDFNDTADPTPPEPVHRQLEAQAALAPQASAVEQDGQRLDYAELNGRANRLARHLVRQGVRQEDRIAVFMDRSIDLVVALLAVAKAGGAYVPIEPSVPGERLEQLLRDSRPVAVLTRPLAKDAAARLREAAGRVREGLAVIDLQADVAQWQHEDGANLPPRDGDGGLQHVAYVIYTSGSSGRPKGVMIEHAGLGNLVAWHCHAFDLRPGRRSSSTAGVAFDACTWEVWPPLCSGGTLVLAPQAAAGDSQALLSWWRDALLDVSFLVTPLAELAYATGQGNPHARCVLVGGDRLRRWPLGLAREQALINNYGPTECSVVATSGRLHPEDPEVHIGRPIRNTRVYVLDALDRPAPMGVAGEMCIAGAGVARGYLNEPALTAEHFLRDPFSDAPDARMYRSGDLARWREDGTLEYLGRNDQQVKVRGVRIEPGEIEARLCGADGVREAVVLVRHDGQEEARLVAYCAGERLPPVDALREHAAAGLPAYMVPSAFVRLDALPLTANGKIDFNALSAPPRPEGQDGNEPPQGPLETLLAGLWSELLVVPEVRRHDHFFELGGHSLLAVQLVSRLRQQLQVELPLAELFDHPVLAQLAQRVGALTSGAAAAGIGRADRNAPLPLSLAQQRLWFLARVDAASHAYHVSGAVRLFGRLEEASLRRALQRIVERHESLRTTFPLRDGQPVQQVLPQAEPDLTLHDLRGQHDAPALARERMQAAAEARFDLQRQAPVRLLLLRLADEEHLLHVTLHHIVADGWSVGVFLDELGALYGAFAQSRPDPLPPLPLQYADYAAWQRGSLADGQLKGQLAFWRQELGDAPRLLELPTDRARPAQQDGEGDSLPVALDAELSRSLRSLSHRHGVTPYMTLLTAWAALLGRLSAQTEVVVGSPAAGRERAEIEPLIGFFVNTLALRIDLQGDPTVAELLARTKSTVLAARRHQDLPFDQVVEAVNPPRSLAHTPLFQVMFDWHHARRSGLQMPGLQVETVSAETSAAQFDLMLSLEDGEDGIRSALNYATALFDRGSMQRHVDCWVQLLRALVAGEHQTLSSLAWVPDAERRLVLETWNDTAGEMPLHLCAHELFEAQVAREPDAIAVDDGGQHLSYLQLNRRANQLARHLRELGVGPDTRVALCAERGTSMVVALLAILKAGGAYVPLDPDTPAERLGHVLQDSAPRVVLCTRLARAGIAACLPAGVPLLDVQANRHEWKSQPGYNLKCPQLGLKSSHLAYVIYTSGSTGRPKGVMVEHRSLVNYTLDAARWFGLGPADAVLQQNSLNFDLSIEEMLPALASGAALLPRALPFGISEEAQPRGVRPTVMHLTAAHWHSLVAEWSRSGGEARARERLAGVRLVNVTGDALSQHRLMQWEALRPEGTRLINTYGPTEITVSCSAAFVRHEPGMARVSIGRPFANTRMLILDAHGQPVPVGVAGELYIGGAGVARGYLNLPVLTAERFLQDPFKPAGRLYKTGDLARWRADGEVEFIGRNDFQIKLRGFRVELGEVEACLARVPGVQEVCVLAREDESGEKRLVAYHTGTPTVPADTLRQRAGKALPPYMVPSAFVHLDTMPLTPGGKLDRGALPAPEAGEDGGAYEAPRGDVEQTLARLWAELLRRERVGRRDNFFELGGHSLLAVSLVERMRRESLQADVSLLFTAPTLADLAAATTPLKEILL